MRIVHAFFVLAATAALLAGCAPSRSTAPRRTTSVTGSTDFSRAAIGHTIGAEELDALTNAYADRYRTLVEDAVAEVVDGNPDARQRASAQRLLVESTSSIYDIATNGDPFSQVLDLTIVVTLTSRVWIEEDRAEAFFGPERAVHIIGALRQARTEIWDLAALVLTQDRLSALDFMIAGWRRANPNVNDVSYVRFGDFAADRGAALIDEAREGGGGLFEPLDKAVEQAKSYERLIERMFFLIKRAPTLVTWQSQSVIDGVLAKDETRRALANLDTVTRSVDELTSTTTKLAEDLPKMVASEREAVFAEIDRRQKDIDATLAQVKAISADAAAATADVKEAVGKVEPILAQAETTVKALEPTLAAVERLAQTSERLMGKVAEMKGPEPPPDPSAPPAKPFDIVDYQRTLAEATTALVEANRLLERGESLAGSPSIKQLISEVTVATEERIASAESAATRLVWLVGAIAAGLVALAFALAFAYRATAAGKGAKS
ncbi:MAG: hypothetical protein ACKO0W_08045 [Planctomycetota bacterium]